MSFDEEILDPHGECKFEIDRLTRENQTLREQNAEMRRTFGSAPIFAEQRLKTIELCLAIVLKHVELRGDSEYSLGSVDTANAIAQAILREVKI